MVMFTFLDSKVSPLGGRDPQRGVRVATRLKCSIIIACNRAIPSLRIVYIEFLVLKLEAKLHQISHRVMYGKKGSTLKKA